ncbi:hypothetical protein [Pseudomonas nunensis]|uniref:hypothetical protein n=1 Tax=Pseudomonas nunensis TaxID=2961896 RepID=UPI0006B4BD1D|nr:hypothetical protein [Pseudomonas nunensis]KOY03749.1 hypothetical protein AM274_05025 [Pseudomonas nunensis]
MQTSKYSKNCGYSKKNVPTTPTAIDETAYLLNSRANAERLIKSINSLRTGKLATKPFVELPKAAIF